MPIEVQCECGKRLRARDESAGRRARCPQCGRIVTLPGAAAPPPPPPPVASRDTAAHEAYEDGDGPADQYAIASTPPAYSPPAYAPPAPSPPTGRPAYLPPISAVAPAASSSRPAGIGYRAAPPRTVAVLPLAAGPAGGRRKFWYWALLLALVPLAWSTLQGEKHEGDLGERLSSTLRHHPELQEKMRSWFARAESAGENTTEDDLKRELFNLLPGHRFDGAMLPYDTGMHWGLAAASAAVLLRAGAGDVPARPRQPAAPAADRPVHRHGRHSAAAGRAVGGVQDLRLLLRPARPNRAGHRGVLLPGEVHRLVVPDGDEGRLQLLPQLLRLHGRRGAVRGTVQGPAAGLARPARAYGFLARARVCGA